MQALLYANLTTKSLGSTLTGGAFTFPKLIAGDHLSLKLRLCEQFDGVNVETKRTLVGLRASIGYVDTAPLSGSFALWAGEEKASSNTTASLAFNATAQQIEDAVNALTDAALADYLPCAVVDESGEKVLRWKDGQPMPLDVAANRLHPRAFVQIRPVEFAADDWRYNIALIQAPGASTSGHQLVLPVPPSIIAVRNGATIGDIATNEVQKLIVPVDYRGQYEIRRGYRKTIALNEEDDVDSVTAALQALADEGGSFVTNNVATGEMLIEFSGTMGGTDQALMTVHLLAEATHDIAFTIATQTDEMRKLLRAYRDRNTQETKLVLEIELRLEDEHDEEVERVVTFRSDVTFVGEMNWPGLDVLPEIDWLRPPYPDRLIPYDWSQTANGQLHYTITCASAIASGQPGHVSAFDHKVTIDHGLGTRVLMVVIRDSTTGGVLLTQGTDFVVWVDDEDSITVEFMGDWISVSVPVVVTIVAFAAVEQFNPHTHPIGDITGLQAALDELGERVAALEDSTPAVNIGTSAATAGTVVIESPLPALLELFPARTQIAAEGVTRVIDIPLASLPRDGALLPAVHDNTITNLSTIFASGTFPTASSTYKGRVYTNNTGGTVMIPGGGQRKGVRLLSGEKVTCDGRFWFKVTNADGNTWYPTEFDRELFVFAVNGDQLTVGRTLEVRIGFDVAILTRKAVTAFEREYERTRQEATAQWRVVFEQGVIDRSTAAITPPGDVATATPGTNLKAITWDVDAPLLDATINVSRVPQTHVFGVTIKRTADTTLVTKQRRSNLITTSESTPASADFMLRARLCCFDLNDEVSDPLGIVALMGFNRGLTAAVDDNNGKITIK